MQRNEILEIAERTICRDRQDIHGNPENTFALIARYWSTYLAEETGKEVEIADIDVAAMMVLFKIARLQVNPNHDDNVIHAVGYMAITGELIGNLKEKQDIGR